MFSEFIFWGESTAVGQADSEPDIKVGIYLGQEIKDLPICIQVGQMCVHPGLASPLVALQADIFPITIQLLSGRDVATCCRV